MNDFLKKYPFYFFLLPIFFLLHINNELFGFLLAKDIMQFLIWIYLFSTVLFAICFLFLKSAKKSAIITFFINLFVLFFGAYHDFVKWITNESVISSYKIFLPISLLAIGLFLAYIIKRKEILGKLTGYLNLLLIILIVVDLAFLIKNIERTKKDHNLIYPNLTVSDNYQRSNIPDSAKPDIYFLVFDEYTNNKTLKAEWNYDNSHISNWLTDQGFHVIPNSKSNYDFTPFSVSSTLNMNYIDAGKGSKGFIPTNLLQSVRSISENETINILKKENYSFRYLTPFVNSFEDAGIANVFNDFSRKQLYNHTLPGRIEHEILWNFITGNFSVSNSITAHFFEKEQSKQLEHVKKTRLTIQKLLATPVADTNRKPQFVYGHIMITHDPHHFDSSGNIVPIRDLNTPPDFFKTYISQVIYTNKVIRELVTTIKKNNQKNTIIIIEGDHGFRYSHNVDPATRFPIFSAIYFPDRNYQRLYENISPVNTFRIVFNHYFYQNFPLLKDSSVLVKITHEK